MIYLAIYLFIGFILSIVCYWDKKLLLPICSRVTLMLLWPLCLIPGWEVD